MKKSKLVLLLCFCFLISAALLIANQTFFSYTVPCTTECNGTSIAYYTITTSDVVASGGPPGAFTITTSSVGTISDGSYLTEVKKNGVRILRDHFGNGYNLTQNFTAGAGDVISIYICHDVITGEGAESKMRTNAGGGCTGSGTVYLQYQ
jgi:hypothetical protein